MRLREVTGSSRARIKHMHYHLNSWGRSIVGAVRVIKCFGDDADCKCSCAEASFLNSTAGVRGVLLLENMYTADIQLSSMQSWWAKCFSSFVFQSGRRRNNVRGLRSPALDASVSCSRSVPQELEFVTKPGSCIESLIHINKKLGQPEAAQGILTHAKNKMGETVAVKEDWLFKLGCWEVR